MRDGDWDAVGRQVVQRKRLMLLLSGQLHHCRAIAQTQNSARCQVFAVL